MMQDTMSNMTELTAAPTASTLVSSVSDEMLLFRGIGSLCGTKILLNSHHFQFRSSEGLSITSNLLETGFKDQVNLLLDLRGQFSNLHDPKLAKLAPTDDLQGSPLDLPSPATVARSLEGSFAASTVNPPDVKHTTVEGTEVAQRNKKKCGFKFYNPIKKRFPC
jgi:hypothetical protein